MLGVLQLDSSLSWRRSQRMPQLIYLPKEAASLGYGCFTRCFGGCFAAGFDGDYCSEFCSEECSDDVRKLRSWLSPENAASVGDICNIPSCIRHCVAATDDKAFCTYWCEDMCGDDAQKRTKTTGSRRKSSIRWVSFGPSINNARVFVQVERDLSVAVASLSSLFRSVCFWFFAVTVDSSSIHGSSVPVVESFYQSY
ncbi:hypothetical protein GUJ93_ZPchr0013g37121 [Zizania palustris]|uniref:Uncharacterized protein n=1 Tax=Zizania palustris TaxID=103762 RepID=A0A8J5WTI7_ZIZPA|nr:hypothetical protein GUJ93_ZPchr0013g37121 [Zizania palustris]